MRTAVARAVALAAAAVVLAACESGGARPTAVVAAADTADQVLIGFSHHVTADGVRRTLLEADTALFFERAQTTVLRRVRSTFYDDRGAEVSRLTAREATYRWQDGALTAKGSVEVTTPEGGRLRTESLLYDKTANRISTDVRFTYDAKGDHVEGEAFRADVDFRNIVTDRPRGTAGKDLVIPGQEAE